MTLGYILLQFVYIERKYKDKTVQIKTNRKDYIL